MAGRGGNGREGRLYPGEGGGGMLNNRQIISLNAAIQALQPLEAWRAGWLVEGPLPSLLECPHP